MNNADWPASKRLMVAVWHCDDEIATVFGLNNCAL
jgi:hypothetical protein